MHWRSRKQCVATDSRIKVHMASPPWRRIYEDLKSGIESGLYSAERPIPTEAELQEKWGVSRLTVYRALHELQRAGFVARKRKAGTTVLPPPPPKPKRIAALFFHCGDYFQGSLLASVRAALPDAHHLFYFDTGRDAQSEAQAVERMTHEADGIVLFPTGDVSNRRVLQQVAKSGFPLVCVDRHPEGVDCDSVQTDNYEATACLLEELRTLGHQRIACICDDETEVSSTADRIRGFVDVARSQGIEPAALLRPQPYLAPNSAEEFQEMKDLAVRTLSELLASPDPPTAVFCSREHYAAAVVEALGQIDSGLEIDVAAFVDRPPYMLALPDKVLRVRQDLETIGRIAADRVMARMDGEQLEPTRMLVPAILSGFRRPEAVS